MATPATRTKSVVKTRLAQDTTEPRRAFPEYLGDITPAAANKMLRGLSNVNSFMNSIVHATNREYSVDCLHDEYGMFLGLVLTPKNPECFITCEAIPLVDERPELEGENT